MILSATRFDFPLGAILSGSVVIHRCLRGGPARGLYLADDQARAPGSPARVLVAMRAARREAPEDLTLPIGHVTPLRGLDRLGRYQAVLEVEPRGAPLAERPRPMRLCHALGWAMPAALAVRAAADAGLCLGGLRPELIYVEDEDAVDGLGLALTAIAPRAERFLGPAPLFEHGYAAPEVMRGGPPSTAADVFSLCAILAHTLSGRHPFSERRRIAWIGSPRLVPLLDRALDQRPERRPQPDQVIAALDDLLELALT
jgi:hypothetical protein